MLFAGFCILTRQGFIRSAENPRCAGDFTPFKLFILGDMTYKVLGLAGHRVEHVCCSSASLADRGSALMAHSRFKARLRVA